MSSGEDVSKSSHKWWIYGICAASAFYTGLKVRESRVNAAVDATFQPFYKDALMAGPSPNLDLDRNPNPNPSCFYKDSLMAGRVSIVTGSNTGIGKETAKALLRMNGDVVMACRDTLKAEETASELRALVPESTGVITVIPLDLSNFGSIEGFVKSYEESPNNPNKLNANKPNKPNEPNDTNKLNANNPNKPNNT